MAPVNERSIEWTEHGPGSEDLDGAASDTEDGRADAQGRFRRKRLGEAAGGDRLGCSLYELPAGARAWPYHYHTANEEAIYVLSGRGTLRLDGDTHQIREGEYVALPADETGAHQVVNDASTPLRYLMISTMVEPDVAVYPDTDSFGVFVGSPPGRSEERPLSGFYRIDDDVNYWGDVATEDDHGASERPDGDDPTGD